MIWLLLGIFVFVFSILGDKRFNPNKSYLFFRILLILSLSYLPSFGGLVAQDHLNYVQMYKEITFSSFLNWNSFIENLGTTRVSVELGYSFLNILAHTFSLGVPGFLFLVCCIINTLVVSVAYRFSNVPVSILLFIMFGFYFNEANLVRQSLSIAIFLYSLKYLNDKNTKSYIYTILIAVSVHSSALFLLPLALFTRIDIDKYQDIIKKNLLVCWILSFGISRLGMSPDFLLQPLAEIGLFSNLYAGYLDMTHGVGAETQIGSVYFINIILIVFAYLNKSKKDYVYTYVLIMGGIITNLSFIIPAAFRLGLYFSTLAALYTPYLCSSKTKLYFVKPLYQKFFYYVIVVYFLGYYILNYVLSDYFFGSKLYPLRMFLE